MAYGGPNAYQYDQNTGLRKRNPDGTTMSAGSAASGASSQEDVRQKTTLDETPAWLKENLSEKNPLPWQQYFDDSITGESGLIKQQLNEAYSDVFAGGLENPNGYLHKALEISDVGPLQAEGGYQSPMAAAIAQKYQAQANDKLKAVRDAQKAEMPGKISKNLGRIANQIGTVQNLKMQNFKEQYAFQQKRQEIYNAWVQANNQAQAQFWGQVLGLGGTAIGVAAA